MDRKIEKIRRNQERSQQDIERIAKETADIVARDIYNREMAKQAQEARDAGDTDAVLNLVSRSLPFLEYFEGK